MDPIELSKIRERSSNIQFGLKYDSRRRSSAYSQRSSFFCELSNFDRKNSDAQYRNRTQSVIAEAQQAEFDVW